MLASELIEKLKKMPYDAQVFIDKDCLSSSESNLDLVTDIYPSPDAKQILLMGEG